MMGGGTGGEPRKEVGDTESGKRAPQSAPGLSAWVGVPLSTSSGAAAHPLATAHVGGAELVPGF